MSSKKVKEETMEDMEQEEEEDMMEDQAEGDESSDDEIASDDDEDKDEDDEEAGGKAFVPGSEKLEEGDELVMDEGAYVVYHQASLGPPCLSFDTIPDAELSNNAGAAFPYSVYGVAGTQAATP